MHAHRHRLAAVITALLILAALPALTLAIPPDGPPGQGLGKVKTPKVPKIEVTLEGSVASTTADNGRVSYTLAVGELTYDLSAGPPWYWRDENPLEQFVGQNVTVVGLSREGSTEVDVRRVNDVEIRTEGRPPWAGGWKRVGALHPGWSADKAERFAQKFGDCFPPGHCKDAS